MAAVVADSGGCSAEHGCNVDSGDQRVYPDLIRQGAPFSSCTAKASNPTG